MTTKRTKPETAAATPPVRRPRAAKQVRNDGEQTDWPIAPPSRAVTFILQDQRTGDRLGTSLNGVQVKKFPIHLYSVSWIRTRWGCKQFGVGFFDANNAGCGRQEFGLTDDGVVEDVQRPQDSSTRRLPKPGDDPLTAAFSLFGVIEEAANNKAMNIVKMNQDFMAMQQKASTDSLKLMMSAFEGRRTDEGIAEVLHRIDARLTAVEQGTEPEEVEEPEELDDEEEEEELLSKVDDLMKAAEEDDALAGVLKFAGRKVARGAATMAIHWVNENGGNPLALMKEFVGKFMGAGAPAQPPPAENGAPKVTVRT